MPYFYHSPYLHAAYSFIPSWLSQAYGGGYTNKHSAARKLRAKARIRAKK